MRITGATPAGAPVAVAHLMRERFSTSSSSIGTA
jgi:hypothetical protein